MTAKAMALAGKNYPSKRGDRYRCVETGETATRGDWGKLLAEKFPGLYADAKQRMASLHSALLAKSEREGRKYKGLTFERVDGADHKVQDAGPTVSCFGQTAPPDHVPPNCKHFDCSEPCLVEWPLTFRFCATHYAELWYDATQGAL